jgi:hypothetical protein
MGITVGSIGIGAVFPAANLITSPFVCPGGQLQLTTQDYQPSPVETVTTLTWYCLNSATGSRREVGIFQMAPIAGTIYGLLLFAVVFAWMWFMARRRGQADSPIGFQELVSRRSQSSPKMGDLLQRQSESMERRLAELKTLRDSGLITEQDYAQKKAAILHDL